MHYVELKKSVSRLACQRFTGAAPRVVVSAPADIGSPNVQRCALRLHAGDVEELGTLCVQIGGTFTPAGGLASPPSANSSLLRNLCAATARISSPIHF
jgi:hypothetical protein